MWEPDTVIFHNVTENFPCPDGLAAAFVVKLKFPNADLKFVGMTYEQARVFNNFLDDCFFNSKVLIVDFSLNRAARKQLDNQGCDVRTIDHHIGALKGYLEKSTYELFERRSLSERIRYKENDQSLFFDSRESGATLTWKLLFPKEPVPPWLELMRQNDLFDFIDPEAEAVHYGMAKLRRSFRLFEDIHNDYLVGGWRFKKARLVSLGNVSIERNLAKFNKIYKNSKKFCLHSGIPIIILNSSEMSLKSRIARHANIKFNSPFTVILDSKLTKFRVKGNVNLLQLFKDQGAAGHIPACSFVWEGMTLDAVKNLVDCKLSSLNEK